MKNLVILFVILGIFGFGNPLVEAKPATKLVPLSEALKNNNIDESSVGKMEVYCMSQSAKRVKVQDFGPINYSFIIFWADDQLFNYPGEFWVSPETKCMRGDIPENFTGKKWRFAHFFHPFPSQVDFIAYIVNKHDSTKPYCRTNVGWAHDYQRSGIGWTWKETSFKKAVVFIPSNEINDFIYPSKPTGGVYFDRNITCFKTLKQAEKGGYKLIKW